MKFEFHNLLYPLYTLNEHVHVFIRAKTQSLRFFCFFVVVVFLLFFFFVILFYFVIFTEAYSDLTLG